MTNAIHTEDLTKNFGSFVAFNGVGFDVVKDADDVRKKIGVVTEKLVAYDRLSNRIGIIDYGKIIALDTLSNLKASAGQNATLEDAFIKLTGTKIRNEPVKNNLNHRPRFNFGGRMR